jgi:hypothetical protein
MYNSQEMIKNSTNEILTVEETLNLRDKFVLEYCGNKGWDKYDLTVEQIAEIRSHTQWKNPGLIRG